MNSLVRMCVQSSCVCEVVYKFVNVDIFVLVYMCSQEHSLVNVFVLYIYVMCMCLHVYMCPHVCECSCVCVCACACACIFVDLCLYVCVS